MENREVKKRVGCRNIRISINFEKQTTIRRGRVVGGIGYWVSGIVLLYALVLRKLMVNRSKSRSMQVKG